MVDLISCRLALRARPCIVSPLAFAGGGRDSTARHLCRRGLPPRESALARMPSGSRASGGRASPQSRSCRDLGLWIRLLFTVISSAGRHVRARLTRGPCPVRGLVLEGRYESAPRWASPEGAHAGGIFGGLPGARQCPGHHWARRCRGDRAAGAGLGRICCSLAANSTAGLGFYGLADGCSGYLRMSGGGAPMRSKASPLCAGGLGQHRHGGAGSDEPDLVTSQGRQVLKQAGRPARRPCR